MTETAIILVYDPAGRLLNSLRSRYPSLQFLSISDDEAVRENTLTSEEASNCALILLVGHAGDKRVAGNGSLPLEGQKGSLSILSLLSRIRKDDLYHSIPCVFIDPGRNTDRRKLFSAGISEILTPPLQAGTLKLVLQRHISLGRRIRNLEGEIKRVRRLKDLAMEMARKNNRAIVKNIERLEEDREKERRANDALHEMSRNELLALNEKIREQHSQEIQSLTEKAHIEAMFGRYVSPAIAEMALDPVRSEELNGARKDITVMFADIRGFTAMTELQKPERTILILNEFFTEMTEIIHRYHGWVDKYIGDSIMALFGAPLPLDQENHTAVAFQTAMELLDHFELIRGEWKEMLGIEVGLGIGLSSGSAIVGNVGSIQKIAYTAIGDTVNVAARLEAMAPAGTALMTRDFYEKIDRRIADIYEIRSAGEIKLKGKSKPVHIYSAGPAGFELQPGFQEEQIGR